MKIFVSEDDDCMCGSDKKYAECCLDQKKVQKIEARVYFDSFFPRIEGLDNMPDLKHAFEKEFMKSIGRANAKEIFDKTFEKYNQKINEINKKLPKPYGVMLVEIKSSIAKENFQNAMKQIDVILCEFPDSWEAKVLRDDILFRLGQHTLQKLYENIMKADNGKTNFLKVFEEEISNSTNFAKCRIIDMLYNLYDNNTDWKMRYAAIDILKRMGFLINFDKKHIKKFHKILKEILELKASYII